MTRLALVMIVRDEERSLARCLNSVRNLVDRIIIMDTGSTDRTVEIARSFSAEVFHMPWPGDFAAARNAALDRSDADWNLVLDADDWLQSGAEALSPTALPALNGARATFVGCVKIIDAEESGATRRNYVPRVLPGDVRYAGRIHEQPATTLPLIQMPVLVLHDGYAEPQMKRKKGRNRALLLRELLACPGDPYLQFQLGRQCLVEGDIDEAAASLLKAYHGSSPEVPFRHSIVIYLILALRWAGRLEDAMTLVDAEQDNWDHSPDFYFAVAELYLDWAQQHVELAHEEILPVVEAAWLKCLQIGENPELDGSVEGSGSFRAAGNLANLYRILGATEEAGRFEKIAAESRLALLG